MANEDHLKVLMQGVEIWNKWRVEHYEIRPDLREARLDTPELTGVNLSQSILWGAKLSNAKLHSANLSGAALSGADLSGADLSLATLSGAIIMGANLSSVNSHGANFRGALLTNANLANANLTNAELSLANLSGAQLDGADVSSATAGHTSFADIDLSNVHGLNDIVHHGPSEVGIGTVYRSEGNIPEAFLRDCGVPESFIVQIPALVAATQPIQFYSCFISYSGKDGDFASRLHSRMRQAKLRVWFAPEDMKGGDKLYDQIDRAIQVHDRLLLALSESSMQSKWVETEIRQARKVERREGRRKLFPIRLVSYAALQEWMCIDSATGEDLAEEVRSYFIPDFSNWKSHDDFEQSFVRLLSDLKASA
jgi:hypothetical protein